MIYAVRRKTNYEFIRLLKFFYNFCIVKYVHICVNSHLKNTILKVLEFSFFLHNPILIQAD